MTLATADHLAPASGSSTPAPGAEPSAPEPAGARWERLAARIIAAAIALFGFLPLMNWVPGGYGDPLFGLMLTEWITGSSIVLGLGVVLAILTRRRANLFPALGADARRRIETWLPAAALAAYAAIALLVFDGRPLLFDEIVQVLQARIFASGRLWAPSFAHREFVEFLHMADLNGRVFSHFPPGGPAVLALGELVGLTWLVNPVCAAASVALFARIARRAEPRTGIALGASVLFAATPFAAFMSGSHMNHVTTLTFTLVGVLGMLLVMERDRVSLLPAFASGLGFGIAATIRPLDTLAYALPAGCWYLGRALREPRRWADALVAASGIAIPAAALLWFNANTTGHPLLLGYTAVWGPGHGVGFHQPPWGEPHTPGRGVELLNLYYLALQRTLFETLLPSLVPVVGALALARRLRAVDRYLLASAVLLSVLYFAYWGEGYFLGPRFLFSLVPVFALWAARFPAAVRDRVGDGLVHRVTAWTLVVAAIAAVAYGIPQRGRQYSRGFAGERFDTAREARRAGVRDAIVFVREEWDMQLLARLWAIDVSHRDAELLHSRTDACLLERELTRVEDAGLRGDSAAAVLRPLMRDAAVDIKAVSAGGNLRIVPGAEYTPRCVDRLARMREGVMSMGSALLAQGVDGNLYVRELGPRGEVLLQEHPERPVYLLAPSGPRFGAPPVFTRLDPDSLRRSWAAAHY